MEKMQNTMIKQYKMFAGLGLVIVLIAFILSLVAADATTTFFSVDKAAREAAVAGTEIVAANVTRQVLPHWIPAFKFVGLGLMLGAITMALGIITQTLRGLGINVMSLWPEGLSPGAPEKPRSAKLFPMLMLMGWMLLIIGLIAAIATNGTVSAYWSNSVAVVLNPAGVGSIHLDRLAIITGVKPWLGALRLTGMTLLFTAITVALTVIIRTLQGQEMVLRRFIQARAG